MQDFESLVFAIRHPNLRRNHALMKARRFFFINWISTQERKSLPMTFRVSRARASAKALRVRQTSGVRKHILKINDSIACLYFLHLLLNFETSLSIKHPHQKPKQKHRQPDFNVQAKLATLRNFGLFRKVPLDCATAENNACKDGQKNQTITNS